MEQSINQLLGDKQHLVDVLKELDEVLSSTRVGIMPESGYHKGIRVVIEDMDSVVPMSVKDFADACEVTAQAINRRIGKDIEPLTEHPVTIDANRYRFIIEYIRNKKGLQPLSMGGPGTEKFLK